MSRESTGRLSLSSSPAPGQITVSGEIVADLIADMHSPGDFSFHVGGQGANVALALARLGMSSTLLMPMSRDALGERFAAILSEAGVRLPLASASDLPTSIALVSLREGQPVYSLYREGVADRDLHRDRILSALPVDPAVHVIGAFCYAVEPDRPLLAGNRAGEPPARSAAVERPEHPARGHGKRGRTAPADAAGPAPG
ncbi:MAG: hypothetical protein IPK20_20680 [Betaproteobacteria bacterium]|nr:hypothetical protein [Betaproteobacteria bacterium]